MCGRSPYGRMRLAPATITRRAYRTFFLVKLAKQ